MKAVPGILPTLLEMICFFSTPTIDVEPLYHRFKEDERMLKKIRIILSVISIILNLALIVMIVNHQEEEA